MKSKLTRMAVLAVAGLALTAGPAAADPVDVTNPQVFADNAFILICGVLVVFMQAGFAMVEAGLTRAKNAAHMMLKNLMDFIVGSTGFALIGYHVAFSGAQYVGFDWQWAGGPLEQSAATPFLTVPVHYFFNMGFAAAAATIVSGAVAERVQFRAYFTYAIAISTLVYPLAVSWVWGGGWLSQMSTPFVDLAGGTVVHVTGGMAALVGATILGPRIGRFDENGDSVPIPGHNLPMAILGVFILLVGWFGFNAGSVLTADLSIGAVAAITAIGGGAGGIGATAASWLTLKTPDVTLIGNGVLGGLVGITAGAANLSLFGALLIGLIAGIIATNGVLLLDRIGIDDPVGAVPVHLMCGAFGTLALGFVADPNAVASGDGPAGFLYGGDMSLLVSQATGVLAIMTYSGLVIGTMFGVLRSIGWLRMDVEHEMAGADLAEHATPAYNEDFVEYEDASEADIASIDDLLEELSI